MFARLSSDSIHRASRGVSLKIEFRVGLGLDLDALLDMWEFITKHL